MIKGRCFITGDCHGDLYKIIDFIQKYNLGQESNIIVLGDIGIFWRKDQKDSQYWINEYEQYCNGVHLYWLDGNHENFDIIKSWTINKNSEYNNSEHIHYCPRGLITNIELAEGNIKKILFMGGADSVDKMWRVEHISWWKDESVTDEDIKNINGTYDYVFSHCCPRSVFEDNKVFLCTISNINENNVIHRSEDKLEELKNNILYENWFFAHYHIDRKLDDKYQCLFKDFVELK